MAHNSETTANKYKTNRTFFLVVFIFFLTITAGSQKIIISGQETKRTLTWRDFKGTPDETSSLFAYTYYNLRYKYASVRFFGDAAIIDGIEVTVELDLQKSWAKVDKITDDLLVHEQGHFTIGILCMKEMLSMFKETSFNKSDYATRLQNIFTETMNKYHNLTIQYDEETRHCLDKEQQLKWNQYFSEKLGK